MPAVKTQPSRTEVDLTRKTPWGTEYRVVRAATVGIDTAEGKPWVTICLDHKVTHESSSLKTACLAGTKGTTVKWCTKCATASKAPKPAPVKKAAVKKVEPAPVAKKATPVKKAPTRAAAAPVKKSPARATTRKPAAAKAVAA